MWTSRRTPAACIAATTARVPSVLTRRRSAPPLKSRGMATRWSDGIDAGERRRRASPGAVTSPIADLDARRAAAAGEPPRTVSPAVGVADQGDDAVAGAEQGRDDVAADEAAGAGDEDRGHGWMALSGAGRAPDGWTVERTES